MTRGSKKESEKTKMDNPRSNEMIAYLNAMTVVSVIFNDGKKFDNVPLTEQLDKLLAAHKSKERRR